jgi:tight adherence protein B
LRVIGYRMRIAARLPRRVRRGMLPKLAARPRAMIERRLALADLEIGPATWVVRAAVWPAGASAAGLIWLGRSAAVVGLVAGVIAPLALLRRRCRRRAERMAEELPEALDAAAGAIRAGLSLAQALREVAADASMPVRGALGVAVASLDVGAPFAQALEAFVAAAGIEQARTVATALAIGHRTGGDLPRVLEALAASMRDRVRLEQQLRAGTAQARLSAWVVAGMPVAFLLLTGATSRAQADLLLRTRAGWGLLVVGGLLEGAGLTWMRRLIRT